MKKDIKAYIEADGQAFDQEYENYFMSRGYNGELLTSYKEKIKGNKTIGLVNDLSPVKKIWLSFLYDLTVIFGFIKLPFDLLSIPYAAIEPDFAAAWDDAPIGLFFIHTEQDHWFKYIHIFGFIIPIVFFIAISSYEQHDPLYILLCALLGVLCAGFFKLLVCVCLWLLFAVNFIVTLPFALFYNLLEHGMKRNGLNIGIDWEFVIESEIGGFIAERQEAARNMVNNPNWRG